jgi:hypothetical protein
MKCVYLQFNIYLPSTVYALKYPRQVMYNVSSQIYFSAVTLGVIPTAQWVVVTNVFYILKTCTLRFWNEVPWISRFHRSFDRLLILLQHTSLYSLSAM